MRIKRSVSKNHKNSRHTITYKGKPSPVIPRTPQRRLWLRYGVLTKSARTKRRGGGCGCESTSPVGKFFIGGTNTNALFALPASNYYPLNDFSKDPNYLAVSSRQTGNFVHAGGKRRRKKSASKKGKRNTRRAKRRTIKGGGYVSDATSALMPIVSNTVVGAASYGAGGAILTPPRYSSYSETNPPPTA